jgi:hypothetical protein
MIDAVRAGTGRVEAILDNEDNAELIAEARSQAWQHRPARHSQPIFVPEQASEQGIGLQDVSTWSAPADTAPHLLAPGSVAADGSLPADGGSMHGLPLDVRV